MTEPVTTVSVRLTRPAPWLLAACLLLASAVALAEEPLSIHFAPKDQKRTAFNWSQNQPSDSPLLSAIRNFGKGRKSGEKTLNSGAASMPERDSGDLPAAAVGKLFFVNADGELSACSAAFAGADDTLVTAAHCVMSLSGDWHSDFVFVPAFDNTRREYYTMECATVPREWGVLEGNAALDYDYAFLKTSRPGQQGYLAVSDELPPSSVKLVGYSNNYRSGRRMFDEDVVVGFEADGKPSYAGNRFGRGASGTPWIHEGTIYSVSSHFDKQNDDVMLGARFDADTLALANYAQQNCRSN